MREPLAATVPLDRPVPAALRDELARRLYFLSAEITGFELAEADGAVRAVRFELAGPVADADLHRKLNAVVAGEVLTQHRPPAREIWRSARRDHPAGPRFDELVGHGAAVQIGPGQVALAGPMITLVDRLDDLLAGLAVTEFGASAVRYPTLLPTSALSRCGYLSSFPHHVMFATRLHADLDVYREFLAGVDAGETVDDLALRLCRTVDLCLPPTMCYHTFNQFAGRQLGAPATVTARGGSFRFESRYAAGLERLWDFTIREVVFLGDREHVVACRKRFADRATALFDELELTGYAEVANDPFFGDARASEAVSAQLMLALKYEARLRVDEERDIAVGSFNVHDRLFTDAFDIALTGGEAAASACVGFGLERLAYAVARQHGLSENDWPAPLRGRTRLEVHT
jgi:seryl-tRNA synthetase